MRLYFGQDCHTRVSQLPCRKSGTTRDDETAGFGGNCMPREASRTARMNMRLTPDAHELIRRAAAIQNQDVSGFVLGAAIDQARQVLLSERELRGDDD